MDMQRLTKRLMEDEGFSGRPICDLCGKPWRECSESREGENADYSFACTAGNMTIAFGRNLDANPITMGEGAVMLKGDMGKAIDHMTLTYPWFHMLGDVRQEVLVNMVFQHGSLVNFPDMVRAISNGNWKYAKLNMLWKDPNSLFNKGEAEESDWHKQTPARCERAAKAMETGEWED